MADPVALSTADDPGRGRRGRARTRHVLRPLVAVVGAAAMVIAGAGVALATTHRKLPGNAEATERKWQPAYDYDTDGCYPAPAIGPDGTLNGGLKPTGPLAGQCRDWSDLDNANGYSRHACNNGWCAYAYGLYFEKDQLVANVHSGHRHDWEHVVVWVHGDRAHYVATSAHGDFTVHAADRVRWEGTHPKVVYHKEGVGSHAFRLANAADEPPENHHGSWHQPTLVGWNGYPAGVREKLSGADWGSANFGLKDGTFAATLREALPAGIPFSPDV
ncbi:secreted protein [Micromonospora sp. ATCC 39149]|uniref:NPP1 family protein n=1 Tax=Micromonospora carbonacea TaxID=47853 RepID=A0A7D6CGL2_9ACTN|nr:NPP1 family protein [Micromonospora sp. ATCC 39149]EEP69732.1 secreted protein [Micromonospora sp. ATCC 39149]QLK01061.1 NPP1 family protein [Micromonospora carbonacea]